MRVLLLVALIASFALSAYAQTVTTSGTATATFYSDATCATKVTDAKFTYANGATTQCVQITPTYSNTNGTNSYVGGASYYSSVSAGGTTVNSWGVTIFGNNNCSVPAGSGVGQLGSAFSLTGGETACVAVTSFSGSNKNWWAKVSNSAASAVSVSAVALFAAVSAIASLSY